MAAIARFPETILIFGGGPAGAVSARGLAAIGYSVTLITEPRPFAALEGISERVVQGLAQAGFDRTLAQLPEPTPRRVTWNGVSSAANHERLVDRQAFDKAILADTRRAGVQVISGRVQRLQRVGSGYVVQVAEAAGQNRYRGSFLVEARGRRAPVAGHRYQYGPATVSILQRCRGPLASAGSAVESFTGGWAWMAMNGAGERYLQLTLDVAHAGLPEKAGLTDFMLAHVRRLTQATRFLKAAEPVGKAYARASTPGHCIDPVGDDWIRVGDAAVMGDPLSGSGLFQALSSALQAPAVVHTLLRRPQDGELAKSFHRQRLADLSVRSARIGRDFYIMEQQWPGEPFWARRRAWPDGEPVHRRFGWQDMRIRQLPVLRDGFIVAREGVVTPDHPAGIWHLGGIPLAPVVRALQQGAWPEAGLALSPDQRQLIDRFIAGTQPFTQAARG